MNQSSDEMSRRDFLARTAAGFTLASLPAWFAREARAASAEAAAARPRRVAKNDTIQIAIIGPGGSKKGYKQGLNVTRHLASKEGVKVVAACDVDATHLREACEAFGPDCRGYRDFREVLADRSVDAVVISTPDHWHAYMCIAAMKAGKDVYCEKPLTLTIDEGKKLVKVWKETGRVFQTGSQQRSDANFRLACELVRNGRLGRLKLVETRLPTGPTGGPFEVKRAPSDLDWNMWLGPARWTPYVEQRCHRDFRWWMEYSGGMLTDWGAHHNDIAQWALGMDRSGPVSVKGSGKYPPLVGPTCYNTFPEFDLEFRYDNGVTLRCTNQGENGVSFIGEEGSIFVTRGKISASDEKLLNDPLPANAERLYVSDDHGQNFIDCIRSRRQPICDAEIGHRSVTVCHLANICLRLNGRELRWDPKKEEFVDDPEANAMLSRPQRRPWIV